jgi:murein tripeptide amidase MpaA
MDTEGQVDDKVKKLLGVYKFYVVPCMCPDGAVLGHLRTNSCGANLNREWASKVRKGSQSVLEAKRSLWKCSL